MKTYKTLLFSVEDGIARLTLNRPNDANSLDMTMGYELMRAAIRCDEDTSIRAVLLTGQGPMFCAGGDLKSFADMGDDLSAGLKELTTYLHAAISRFHRMNAPLIVAVNGTAAGAGMSLAAAGDLTLAAESATFTLAYTAAGLSPDGSASYFLPRLIGLRRARELMLTNRALSAREAAEWGLIERAVADDQLVDEALGLARRLAAGPTLAFGAVKTLLADTYQQSLESQMEHEARAITRLVDSADGREGLDAFINKRRPNFRGQ